MFSIIIKYVKTHIFIFMLFLNLSIFTTFVFYTNIDRSGDRFVKFLMLPLIVYLFTILIYEKNKIEINKRNLKLFWAYTIVIRIIVLFIPIGLSDDIYRYVWDGHIQQNGINPYLHNPDSVNLEAYRTNWSSKINNPDINSPYPPFAQIIFFVVTSFTNDIDLSIVLIRLLIVGFDLGAIIVLKILLKHFNIPQRRVMIYAWSPLVIFEFAGNGHIDGVAVFFSLLALLFILEGTRSSLKIISPLSLSIAILTKVYPIILLPFLVLKWNLREKFTFLLTSIILIFPYSNNGINPLYPQGQQSFVQYFNFNESFFQLYRDFIGKFYDDPDMVARYHYIIFMIIFSGLLYLKYIYLSSGMENETKVNINILSSFRYILLIGLLFSPDVQPWYIIWILPLAAIFYDWIIITLSMTILFSYQIYPEYDRTGIWFEDPIILTLEYLIVYLMLFYQTVFQSYFRDLIDIDTPNPS
ncbi:MAG: DUF2029 domain-containing protein [Candidatus Heimdallarchaeota archaeon]|nr:DUF2029 domain-containing protein [Candidatus Heimdallarchaeota archaeon]